MSLAQICGEGWFCVVSRFCNTKGQGSGKAQHYKPNTENYIK